MYFPVPKDLQLLTEMVFSGCASTHF